MIGEHTRRHLIGIETITGRVKLNAAREAGVTIETNAPQPLNATIP